MSSTAAVASSVNYHLPKQVDQEFNHKESSQTLPKSHVPHTAEELNYGTRPSYAQLQSIQKPEAIGLSDSAKLVSSNIDSALRSSLKPWINNSKLTNTTLQVTNASELIPRSLIFHESSAPSLDSVIRQKIENHPKSLILCESTPQVPIKVTKRTLCTDAELTGWCRSGSNHVPHQSLGLGNSGNTCYLNSVLQCLLATGPLLAYINSKHCNSDDCFVASGQMGANKSRFCALCGILRLAREHNQRSQQTGVRTPSFGSGHLLPTYFLANVRAVCPGFRPYQQEDAHEFLLGLLSRMEDSSTAGLGKLPRAVSETNAIRRMFGGIVRSEVTCHTCHNVSARDEICFNLSVDITCGRSLQQCLFNYIHSEELCGQNAYKCEKCRQYRSATRRSTIFQGGPILIIQFNRFSRHQKLDTRVEFPSSFNLRPFMTDNKGPPVLYRLYATVNHEGYSCRSGHYVAFTRRHGVWLSHNDSFVNSTNVEHVLRQAPYLLFYEATNPVFSNPVSSDSTPVSPLKPSLDMPVAKGPVKLAQSVTHPSPCPVPTPTPVSTLLTPVGATPHIVTAAPVPPSPVQSSAISGPRPPPTTASVPRIVFNPSVAKQLSSPTTAPLVSTVTIGPQSGSPTKASERIAVDSAISNSSTGPGTSLPHPTELLSKARSKPSTAPLFTSATVLQLLYGDTSTPGLWSERSTPPVTGDDLTGERQPSNKSTGHTRPMDDLSYPRKRKHSPSSSTSTPTPAKTSSSSKSSESSTSRERDSTTRNGENTSPSVDSPSPNKRPRRRRSSESSSHSSIVWVPNGSHNGDRSSYAKHGIKKQSSSSKSYTDRPQWRTDREHNHAHHKHHHKQKSKHYKSDHDSVRRIDHHDRSPHRRHGHHQTHRDRRKDRGEDLYRHRHGRTHGGHTYKTYNNPNVFHRSHKFHRSA